MSLALVAVPAEAPKSNHTPGSFFTRVATSAMLVSLIRPNTKKAAGLCAAELWNGRKAIEPDNENKQRELSQ
jgi:hypothetical protein